MALIPVYIGPQHTVSHKEWDRTMKQDIIIAYSKTNLDLRIRNQINFDPACGPFQLIQSCSQGATLKMVLETICGRSVSPPKIFDLRTDVSDLTRMADSDHVTTFLNENRDSADFRLFCRGETFDVHLFILGATLVFVLISF